MMVKHSSPAPMTGRSDGGTWPLAWRCYSLRMLSLFRDGQGRRLSSIPAEIWYFGKSTRDRFGSLMFQAWRRLTPSKLPSPSRDSAHEPPSRLQNQRCSLAVRVVFADSFVAQAATALSGSSDSP